MLITILKAQRNLTWSLEAKIHPDKTPRHFFNPYLYSFKEKEILKSY